MLRIIFWFIVLAAMAAGLTWLAEHPGRMTIDWLGYHIEEMPVALALGVIAAGLVVLWLAVRIVRMVFVAPGAAVDYFRLRRKRKGLEELSTGLVALLAGDAASARRAANRASRLTPDEPVARLLEARAAHELGDEKTARALLLRMLEDEKTEPAALHGLYEQARRAGDMAAAREWATRAWRKYPTLPWAAKAMLAFLAADRDWAAVTRLLEQMRTSGLIDRAEADRLKAVAFTAQALDLEERAPQEAMDLAIRAHKLDPSLIPAAVIAGGMLAARGSLRKAAKILEKTWKLSPHPDIGEIYAHLRAGDSPVDRLKRVQKLLRLSSGGEEGAVVLARAAIEARDWDTARGALRNWINNDPSSRIYQLMAEIEEAQYGDRGRAREWLARAVRARRNPAWTADGIVSPQWLPASPVTGELGVFQWKTPVEGSELATALEPVPADLLEAPQPEETMRTVGEQKAEEPSEEPPADAGEVAVEQPAEAGANEPQTASREAETAETVSTAAETPEPETLRKGTADEERPEKEQTQPAQTAPVLELKAEPEEGAASPAAPAEKKPEPTEKEATEIAGDAGTETRPTPPPPGRAPAAPPIEKLRTAKSHPRIVEEDDDIRPPIPDDPGPRSDREEKRRRGWFH